MAVGRGGVEYPMAIPLGWYYHMAPMVSPPLMALMAPMAPMAPVSHVAQRDPLFERCHDVGDSYQKGSMRPYLGDPPTSRGSRHPPNDPKSPHFTWVGAIWDPEVGWGPPKRA